VTTFCSSSNATVPGNREIRAEVTVLPAVRADLGRVRATQRWCGVSTPSVVHFEYEALAQRLTGQDISDGLADGAVISLPALAIRQAGARPCFGSRAPYPRTKQVACAGDAQFTWAVGQSRDARC
jgi:hypothetical protein